MNFAVIGAGAWGTAFAIHLARAGQAVQLVPRRAEHAEQLQRCRENADYLPGIALPENVGVTAELAPAVAGAEVLLLACPSQALRETAQRVRAALARAQSGGEAGRSGGDAPLQAAPGVPPPRLVLSLAKGLEVGSHKRPCEVIAECLPDCTVGALTGPTNAAEVARGQPAAMLLACAPTRESLTPVQAALSSERLRVYTSADLVGAELGGCLKNIYAIAAGCCDGLRLGDNARAALLTRALAEMLRVGVALGAQAETFYGLSGFGDLVATCHGAWSRNRQFGEQLGAGARAADLLAGRRSVVEGYKTTQSFAGLCAARGIDAPILREMYAILFEGKAPAAALSALMTRELKQEGGDA
ncbi:glycerol-3-phosphate dehydrogenase [Cephaloticoccus primus]|uniref:Glycerol-3-phosphate dehydrogenase [NAD(P)+] n=1 Tax=Cephaloticoccus primus TaxID=1548207 RepID=A0A139SPU1_9BACT|nr:NAD(P)H-dependent glycerol-3-phosphate dehydrogenase [Cephaloticoccus primus]KXU36542.1 glycerol-3-phosphate dehydrogenase [Cephaloticoccus primus]